MTAETIRLSGHQREAITAIGKRALDLGRRGHGDEAEVRERAVAWSSGAFARPTLRVLADAGLIAGGHIGGRLADDASVTDAGLEAGGTSAPQLRDAIRAGELERVLNDRAQERREAEANAKWARLSQAFDGITYDDWQYVTGAVPDQDLGANIRESLDGPMSPFRSDSSGVTIRTEALEQIAERILELRVELRRRGGE